MAELFLAELKRASILFWRYPVEAVSRVLMVSFLFYGLLLGARSMAGESGLAEARVDAAIVGYILWSVTASALSGIAAGLQAEMQTGTLEQLYLSPYGPLRVVLLRALAELGIHLGLNLGSLWVILWLTGHRLAVPSSVPLPLLAVLLGAFGLGLAMGALVLLFKRVQQILGLTQFVLLILLMAPPETWEGAGRLAGSLLPTVPGAGLLRDLMASRRGLDLGVLGVALLNGLGYFWLGSVLFRGADRQARKRGLVNAY